MAGIQQGEVSYVKRKAESKDASRRAVNFEQLEWRDLLNFVKKRTKVARDKVIAAQRKLVPRKNIGCANTRETIDRALEVLMQRNCIFFFKRTAVEKIQSKAGQYAFDKRQRVEQCLIKEVEAENKQNLARLTEQMAGKEK